MNTLKILKNMLDKTKKKKNTKNDVKKRVLKMKKCFWIFAVKHI